MHADDLVINDSGTWETVERVAECFPKLDTEAAATLIIETVYPVDSRTLMVSTEDEKVLWILDLVGEE